MYSPVWQHSLWQRPVVTGTSFMLCFADIVAMSHRIGKWGAKYGQGCHVVGQSTPPAKWAAVPWRKKKKILCLAVAELCLRARKCFRWQNSCCFGSHCSGIGRQKKAFLYSGNTFCWSIDIL
ncbi:hypothetical protein LI328DRAFT_124704 [Trichoderma asperelloides]|nr:hypothetical protein LI328DRAFT_124704 [Trichoderma asperelloides]